eukprot:1001908-Heterocapsa_arctica.AAC.1
MAGQLMGTIAIKEPVEKRLGGHRAGGDAHGKACSYHLRQGGQDGNAVDMSRRQNEQFSLRTNYEGRITYSEPSTKSCTQLYWLRYGNGYGQYDNGHEFLGNQYHRTGKLERNGHMARQGYISWICGYSVGVGQTKFD